MCGRRAHFRRTLSTHQIQYVIRGERIIFCIDALICLGAYAASTAPPGSTERLLSAGLVVGGMLFGILEKLPKLFLPKTPPGAPEAAAN